ncbi:hypothetical protein RRG08_058433 [Elysia crispata]|uniref:Uncharacterized protein n=1 Tax=Elysia crispata TaxID=231223 RepID=A0AAE1AB99_9GAST|nr:hypothetical protein RRG08_058433 [Elysia crispata]
MGNAINTDCLHQEELLEQIFDSEEDDTGSDEEYPFSSESDESEEESIMALNQIAACFLNVSNASSGEGFDNQLAGTFLLQQDAMKKNSESSF